MTSPDARPGPGQKRIRGHLVREQISWTGLVPVASTGLILTFGTVAFGRALNDQSVITPKTMAAAILLTIPIVLMNQFDPMFAGAFAMLLFIVSFLVYGPDILNYLGFAVQPGEY